MSRYQKFVVALLAFLQFTVVLDFMTLSPLGAFLMPALHISPAQFAVAVSAYAFSAGASGLLAAGFADRFDRKRFLLFFYGGFLLGTLFCGLASTYPLLVAARIVTGVFGGVLGSIVFAITTDLFPFEMRGRVMGFVQTAFAGSQVLGIPVGLYLATIWGWHAPFFLIVGVGLVVGVFIVRHLRPTPPQLAGDGPRASAFVHLRATLLEPGHFQAFATTALLSTVAFMLLPFASAFTVHNLGIPLGRLPLVYLVTGLCTLFTGPLIGRAADRFGKFRMFVIGTAIGVVTVLVYTRLGPTPLPWVIVIDAVMFIGVFSRIITSQALLSGIPRPHERGAFMSISSSVQEGSGGVASLLAGAIVSERVDGVLEHVEVVGYVVVLSSLLTLVLMNRIRRRVPEVTAERASANAAELRA